MKATVYVRLKGEVLDPQGDAVRRGLEAIGVAGVRSVRIGKLVEIELDDDGGDPAALRARIDEAARELLANPVIEDYEVIIG